MVAKKKKVKDPDLTVYNDERLTSKYDKLENVPSNGWPKISQGTHLIVRTYEDGRTELIWDDEQLAKEVREAIASVESKPKKKKPKILNSVELSMDVIEKAKKSSKKGKKK